MALSAFRRRTTGPAPHSTDGLRPRAAPPRGPQPQRSEPLTLDEVSAAVRAAKASAPGPDGTAVPADRQGAVMQQIQALHMTNLRLPAQK